MTRKQKLFKGWFFIFICALSLAMALHNFICLEETNIYSYSGNYINREYYGGDAYTGIQQAVADTGNNVNTLGDTVARAGDEILEAFMVTSAFIFTLVFFVCLYVAIKTFTEKIEEEAKASDTVHAAATVAEKANGDEITEIERFNDLKERGLISEEEFELKRKKLLGI